MYFFINKEMEAPSIRWGFVYKSVPCAVHREAHSQRAAQVLIVNSCHPLRTVGVSMFCLGSVCKFKSIEVATYRHPAKTNRCHEFHEFTQIF